MSDFPKFVVVGHPNKGKSSIISTLTMNDSVKIGELPGTTTKAKNYSLKIDGKTFYEFIDTPGFQRPRRVYEYLKSFGDVKAIDRPKLLKQFLEKYENNPKFHDECELLRPIIEGARILYIVDASKPYSDEYEMEMEILRYAGTPSMAILNYISDKDYTDEWNIVLGQYFRLVKKFNPLKASHDEHIDLLEAIAHLDPVWSDKMKDAVKLLKANYQKMLSKMANLITKAVKDALSFKIVRRISHKRDIQKKLEEDFKKRIEQIEKKLQNDIKSMLYFKNIKINIKNAELKYDLFSEQSKEIFGLKREKLILISTLGSAVSGGMIDLAVGGHSFFLGTLIGGVTGFVGSIYGYEELGKIKFISKEKMQVGPIKDINFGFIFLNRSIIFAKTLLSKSHADRKEVLLNLNDKVDSINLLKKLNKFHQKFSKNKESEKDLKEYEEIVLKLLNDKKKG